MITNDFNVKLLEINHKIYVKNIDKSKYFENYFEGIMEEIVDKYFLPINTIKKSNNLIKL